ncbi:MAG: hypothetical protein IKV16_01275, partial [Clostridia bacterium]|nr:hypothetical protein [Clostridia bacterium]
MKKKLGFLSAFIIIFLSLVILVSCSNSEEEHEHTFTGEWSVKVSATTEAEGVEVNICDTCQTEVTRAIPKHVHTLFGEWTLTAPATEGTPGTKTCVCATCGESVSEAVYYCTEHSYIGAWSTVTAPTVDSVGKESNLCALCGATVVRDIAKVTLTELRATKAPYTTVYFTGELFNPYGLEVTAFYSDGSSLVLKNYELINPGKLTADDSCVKVKYGGLTLDIPISVSKYFVGSVSKAMESEDGAFVYVKGFCIASLKNGTEDQIVIRSLTGGDHILVSGVNYPYEMGDKVAIYTTVASNENEKYLIYAEDNGNGDGTVLSKGNSVLSVADELIVGS